MSDLTITHAGHAVQSSSGNKTSGACIRVRPTISGTPYAADDVICLTTEIPNFSRIKGGTSKLHSITVITAHAATVTSEDYSIVFMQKGDKHLRTPINPGAGPVNMSAADLKLAQVVGMVFIDAGDNELNWSTGQITTGGGGKTQPSIQNGSVFVTADDDTSLYFSMVCDGAVDFVADGDLEVVFNIEYLD